MLKQYIVDAFTDEVFKGNTAAVCVSETWLSPQTMQKIAKENQFSETAFVVKEKGAYQLHGFTPENEIDFCGHGTLAAAYVISRFIEPDCPKIKFRTLSGDMAADTAGDFIEIDFPKYQLNPVKVTDKMIAALGIRPTEAYLDRDLLMILDSEEAIFHLQPNYIAMKELDGLSIAVTAKGRKYDCVSRVFAPELNIPEDPVTGSTHCMIVPYWVEKLGKTQITAFQASERTGVLYAKMDKDRIKISGKAVLFGITEIFADLS